jgi:hypothetical protein
MTSGVYTRGKAPRFLADDDTVMCRGAAPLCDIDDRLRYLDVGARGVGSPEGWLCTRMTQMD